MAVSRDQLHNGGTWLYRIVLGAIAVSMWAKVDRTVDLCLIHEGKIDQLEKYHNIYVSDYKDLLAEVKNIRESQIKINAKLEPKTN